MLVGLVAGTVGLAQVVLDELVTLPPVARRAVAVAALVWLALVLAVGSVAALAVTDGHPVAWARHTLQRTVDRVGTDGGQAAGAGQAGSRFGSLDTGRYDLWKVAARGFRERPAEGFGAGNFGYLNVLIGRPFLFPYQAHSQLLEVAATLGFPGLALYLAALLLPIGACIWLRASGTQPKTDQLLAAGIGGALGYFAVHAQVDWIWQLSSCALPALLLAATAVAMLPPGRERPRSMVAGGAALLLAVLAARGADRSGHPRPALPGALVRGAGRRRPQRRAPRRRGSTGSPAAPTWPPPARCFAPATPRARWRPPAARRAPSRSSGWPGRCWPRRRRARRSSGRRWPRVRGCGCLLRTCRSSCGPRCRRRASTTIDSQPTGSTLECCAHEALPPRVDRGSAGRRLQQRWRRRRHQPAWYVVRLVAGLLDPRPLRRRPTCT